MPDTMERKGQFAWIPKLARVFVICSLVLLSLAVVACIAATVNTAIVAAGTGEWLKTVPYALVTIAALLCLGAAPLVYGLIHTILANESGINRAAGRLGRIETLMEDQLETLRDLNVLACMSDQAKSLVYRDKEIETLREAVHDDMLKQDYVAAEAKIQVMEERLGYAESAARLREELIAERQATLDQKIDWAVGRIEKIMELHDWDRAIRAAEKLRVAFPANHKVVTLPQRVETEQIKHKRQLLQDYGEAIRKNDIDAGIMLLKELDRHLSPQEAAALKESARGVFRAKLHNLGVQFALRVTEQRWDEAATIGEQIIRSFPNSRMGHEVSEKMPQLRANETAMAENQIDEG